MTNLVISRPCDDDTVAMQTCMAIVEQAIQNGYVEGPAESAVNDVVLGDTKCTIEFNSDKILDSASLAQLSKQKTFSSVLDISDDITKTFSLRTINERLKFMDLPLPKQFRKLIIENRRYYKMNLAKLIEAPEKFKALKQLFITDFMQFFTSIMGAVGEGDEKLAESLGINRFAPKAIKAARLLQRDLKMINKLGGAPKAVMAKAQEHFAVFIDAITDHAFPGWRETFKDKLETTELELSEEDEKEASEEKEFSDTREFANEQAGEEAEGEMIELSPAEEALFKRQSEVEGDGKAIFSAPKTCSSILKKSKRQFGVTQNQRQQMDHTQEELEKHPEIPGSMGVHEEKNELEEINPLKKEKADTGKDVSAKNGEDHGHGITPKGEKTFAFDGMPMEINEYESVDRTEKKTKTASSLIKGKKKLFSEDLYLKINSSTSKDVLNFIKKLNNLTLSDFLKAPETVLSEYEKIKDQIQDGEDKDKLVHTLDEALLQKPENFLPVSEDPTILENAPVLRSEARNTNGKEIVNRRLDNIMQEIKELHEMDTPEDDGNALPGNVITKEALGRVPGVGPQLAEAILDYFNIRDKNSKQESRKEMITSLKEKIEGSKDLLDNLTDDDIIQLTEK